MALSIIFHSAYSKFPHMITSLLFPVNESIWEHGKMILSAFVGWILIEKHIFKDRTNVVVSNLIAALICIILNLLIFTPIFLYILKTEDNLPLTIMIYAICIIISLYIREKYLRKENDIVHELWGILIFVIIFCALGTLSYYPLRYPIFYDYNKELYGIPK